MTVFLILLAFILGVKIGRKSRPKQNTAKRPKRKGSVSSMESFWSYDGSEQI